MGKLTALTVKNARPGRHADGEGLMLLVSPSGAKSWVLRVQVAGKRKDLGVGSASAFSLSDARAKAAEMRRQAKAGIDVVAERKKAQRTIPTFETAARDCFAEMKSGWSNGRHTDSWLSSIESYAFPAIGRTRVDLVDGPMIRDLLSPIWPRIPTTARRVLQRIGTVLDFSHSKGWRAAETPTRSVLKGLPKQRTSDRHFAAMPFEDVPSFMAELAGEAETVGRMALMLVILTAARSGEVRGCVPEEFNFESKLWTIPAARMKARKEHVVPLTDRAIAIVKQAMALSGGEKGKPVFAGRTGKALSDMTLSKIMRNAGKESTVHGFRSSFRDWAAEKTNTPTEVVEKALAHGIPNKVEAAYRRTDFLERRRKLMLGWERHLVQTRKVG
jgi:integrase